MRVERVHCAMGTQNGGTRPLEAVASPYSKQHLFAPQQSESQQSERVTASLEINSECLQKQPGQETCAEKRILKDLKGLETESTSLTQVCTKLSILPIFFRDMAVLLSIQDPLR